ncbi:MAG: lipopolysaccharide biosynthesis protein [Lachnospiraceae bacterium]
MDKKRGMLNIGVSVGVKVLLLIGSVLVRRFLIRYLGSEINGLNSLYINIIGFIAVAELGVGSAIVFCMYKPIVDGDETKVTALYRLIEKLYRIIGAFILAAGLCVTPFLPRLAKDCSVPRPQMYTTFIIMLVSVVLTYMYSAKVSLLEAYKNNYIATGIMGTSMFFQYGLQIVAVLVFRTFHAYLLCRVIAMLIQWLLLEIYCRRKYSHIIKPHAKVDKETAGYVSANIKAMFMHKIGNVMVNTAGSIIISAFIGVVELGKHSNYTIIMTSMIGILNLFFTPLTSIIGHLYAKEDAVGIRKYFNFFHGFNFVLATVFFLGYYAIIDNLITVVFAPGLELLRIISFVITYSYFIQFMRNATVLFRDATGTFYKDRWKAPIEGAVNIILSIVFVLIFPEGYKELGVIAAAIITNLLICHIVEPLVLYKYALKASPAGYYVRNYVLIAVFGGLLFLMDKIMVNMGNRYLEILVNGCIAVGVGLAVFVATTLLDKDFRYYFKRLLKRA